MPEKRGYMRYPITDCASLKDLNGTTIASGLSLNDISFNGMSLELKDKIGIGTAVQFELITDLLDTAVAGRAVVKNMTEVKYMGKVIFRAGLEFVDVNKDEISALLDRIQQKMRQRVKRAATEGGQDFGPF